MAFTLPQHIVHHCILGVTSGGGGGGVSGGGIINFLPRWDASGATLVDSHISDDGDFVYIAPADDVNRDGGYIEVGSGAQGTGVVIQGGAGGSLDGGPIDLEPGASGSGVRGHVRVRKPGSALYAIFEPNAITADRTYAFPDFSGTLALGSGVQDYMPKWSASGGPLVDSTMQDDGANIRFSDPGSGKQAVWDTSLLLTSNRTYTFPDFSGTLALMTAAGTAGQLLRSAGAASAATWTTATFPATAGTNGNVLTSNGTNWVSSAPTGGVTVTGTPSASQGVRWTGASSIGASSLVNDNNLTWTVTAANGGAGAGYNVELASGAKSTNLGASLKLFGALSNEGGSVAFVAGDGVTGAFALGGSINFTAGQTTVAGGAGGGMTFQAGYGNSSTGTGGALSFVAGHTFGSGTGGLLEITAGSNYDNGQGGNLTLASGEGGPNGGDGGDFLMTSGNSYYAQGGDFAMTAGASFLGGQGGSFTMASGEGVSAGGDFNLGSAASTDYGPGGNFNVTTGSGGPNAGNAGYMRFETGSAPANGYASGEITFVTGRKTVDGDTGYILFKTGDLGGAGSAGYIAFQAGSGGGGEYRFANPGDHASYAAFDLTNLNAVRQVKFPNANLDLTNVSSSGGVFNIAGTSVVLSPTNLSFYGVTAVARASAYTQTYATASKTHPAVTSSAVVTTGATLAAYGFTQAQADSIPVAINAVRADLLALKQVVNAIIDDHQAYGLFQ